MGQLLELAGYFGHKLEMPQTKEQVAAYHKQYNKANAARIAALKKERLAERIAAGLCPECGANTPTGGKQCEPCRAKSLAQHRRYYRAHYVPHPRPRLSAEAVAAKKAATEKARGLRRTAERKAAGLCPACGRVPPANNRRLCEACLAYCRKASRKWNTLNRAYKLSAALVKTYGITLIQREMMLDLQGRRCAGCGTDDPGPRKWQVDHDHAIEKAEGRIVVRGILCSPCNLSLGSMKDNIDGLRGLIAYLTRYRMRIVRTDAA